MKYKLLKFRRLFESEETEGRVWKALFFSFVGAGLSKALIMLLNILLSRVLGAESYGQYALINSTIQTFVTFASMGLGASMVRYTAIYRHHNKKLCGQIIGTFIVVIVLMSLLVVGIVFLSSDTISIWTAQTSQLGTLYKVASAVILFVAFSSIMQNILLGLEAYKSITKLEVLYGIAALVLTCSFAVLWGVAGALFGMLAARFLYSLFLTRSALSHSKKQAISWKVKFDRFMWKIYKEFTFPSFMSSIFVIPVSWLLNSMLVRNAGFADMAVYSVSVQWVSIINYITSLFTRVKPIYAQLYSEKNYQELKKQLWRIVKISSAIGVSIALLCALFSKLILRVYGNDYLEHQDVFVVMMMASAMVTVQSQFGSVFEAIGKMWIGFLLNIVWAINLFVFFSCFLKMGALGYSISYFLAYFLHCILSWIVIWFVLRNGQKQLVQ